VIRLFYSIAAMNALFSSMAWCAAKSDRWSILALLTFAVIWPFVNGDLDGEVLLTLDGTSGITVSDLLSVLAAVIAFIQAIRRSARPCAVTLLSNTVTLRKSPEQFTTRAEPALLPLHTVSSNFPENPGQVEGATVAKTP
jgi:hypothetical protein